MRMDLSNRAEKLTDMRMAQTTDQQHIQKHYDTLRKFAL